jgi:hypothetical protein
MMSASAVCFWCFLKPDASSGFQLRHAARHEAAVLADRVAAHRRLVRRHPLLQEGDQFLLGLRFVDGRCLDAVDQAGFAVRALVPVVHLVQRLVALVDGEHRAFGQHIQVRIRDDDGHFDDAVVVRIQAGHFHVEPDEVEFVGARRGIRCLGWGSL